MRDELEIKFTTAREIYRVLDENSAEFAANEYLTGLNVDLGNLIAAMIDKDTEHQTSAEGKTVEKSNARKVLSAHMLAAAGQLRSIGRKENDMQLVSLAKITQASLDKLRDTNFENKGKLITEKAEEKAVQLAARDFDAADIAALRSAYEAYKTASSAKEGGVTNKSAAYDQLNAAADELDDLLDDIEDVMENYKLKKPAFYLKYEIACREVNTGIRHENPEPAPPQP